MKAMTTAQPDIKPIIMCGGAGTRLWPASRETMPKHLLKVFDGRSSFQLTVKRVAGDGFQHPLILSAAETRFLIAEQLHEIGVEADIVLEPMRRDSAAAVAAAAVFANRQSPETICCVLAADHIIDPVDVFIESCRQAAAVAAKGYIMTLGVEPTAPATGFGYIARGQAIAGTSAFAVKAFVEKPDEATAKLYLKSGYLWNSGNFMFPASLMVAELRQHALAILAAVEQAVELAKTDLDFVRLDADAFAKAPKTSIDYAVMEKTKKAGTLPVRFGWSDVGNWDAMWQTLPKDGDGNSLDGNVSVLSAKNSLVHSTGALTTVVGLDNAVVVTMPDAVMVTTRENSGLVKDLVSKLVAEGRSEASEHLRGYRPWGWYQRIDIGGRFQVKRICVNPGGRLSLQKHFHRAEHWVVVHGTAEVTVDDTVTLVHENGAIYLPIGCTHRLVNPGKIPLHIIEVQVGSYTGEDDIVRIEDVYGR